ncbi:unnamed protein product [Clonostachys rosea f. rosea IK726]|uniref:Uncharacterized protein n=1 Tax=Clonostachys rosea f. rosea IK726 TaxID=1349383 RepID=A0ACA9TPL2_BIOOC|nr:unnamed protein product [Clonostachys rosea f. rosea IK726]
MDSCKQTDLNARIYIYYGLPGIGMRLPGATVTGNIILLTSNGTLYRRLCRKTARFIAFKDDDGTIMVIQTPDDPFEGGERIAFLDENGRDLTAQPRKENLKSVVLSDLREGQKYQVLVEEVTHAQVRAV